MKSNEVSRQEIESRFMSMGDYVKIDYLTSCLKKPLDYDTRKFVLVKLAGLFETRSMFNDAGKVMRAAAEINTTFQGKINDFIKSAEYYIRGGSYEEAETSVKRALPLANEQQKSQIKKSVKEIYKLHANNCLRKDKRKSAVEVFEKMLELELDIQEREDVNKKLVDLYSALGRINDYNRVKKSLRV